MLKTVADKFKKYEFPTIALSGKIMEVDPPKRPQGTPYKALFISDIHLSNKLPGARVQEDGYTDRLEDQLAMLQRVRTCANENDVDGVFILGDLFDQSKVDAITLTAAVRAITAFEKPVRILAGNHDAVSTKGGRFTVEMFGEMGNANVKYMRTGVAIRPYRNGKDPGWLTFHPVEYAPQEQAMKWIEQAGARAKSGTDVLLMHHSILGAQHNNWTCDDGLDGYVVTAKFSAVYSGHFHTTAAFGSCGMYLGAPLHLRIEDEGRKAGWWLSSFYPTGEIDNQFTDGGCPRFHTLNWDVAEDVMAIKGLKKHDYIRLIVQATQAEWAIQKPKVLERVEIMEGRGFRASFQHKPIYHHSMRIPSGDKGLDPAFGSAAAKPELAIDAYVESEDVATDTLDKAVLKRIGREALEAVR